MRDLKMQPYRRQYRLALLWLLVLRLKSGSASAPASVKSSQLMILSLLVIVQITLGDWTSTNYAAKHCFC